MEIARVAAEVGPYLTKRKMNSLAEAISYGFKNDDLITTPK